jgi:hypothetical protein
MAHPSLPFKGCRILEAAVIAQDAMDVADLRNATED